MVTRSSILLGMFVLSLPITVRMGRETSSPDTTSRALVGAMRSRETRFTAAAGASTFGIVDRGCNNEFLRSQEFRQRDVGGALEQHVTGPLSVGLRAGAIQEKVTTTDAVSGTTPPGTTRVVTHSTRENSYVNPYVRIQNRSFEVSAGGVLFRDPFLSGDSSPIGQTVSFGLRVGRLDRIALRASWMEGVPLLGERDQFMLGGEAWPATNLGLFLGLAAGSRHGAFLVRGEWWVAPAAALDFSGRVGPGGSEFTTAGVSLGLTLRTPPHDAASPPVEGRDAPEAPAAPSPTPPDSSRRSP